MFNSPILDVAFGLLFVFFAVSLAAGTILEVIASITRWRAATLLSGIKALVNDSTATGLALALYKHASISPRDNGRAVNVNKLKKKPAYVDPQQFANAMLDIIDVSSVSPGSANAVGSMVTNMEANIADPQLRQLLTGIIRRAQGDFDKMKADLANWFDNGMDRLSGVYKRWSQLVTFLIALVIAIGCNVDTIAIGTQLWHDPTVVNGLKVEQQVDAKAAVEALAYVPIGWTDRARIAWSQTPALVALGSVITALASLFGAPFWFDTLQTVARLKGSGPSPSEKKAGVAAAA